MRASEVVKHSPAQAKFSLAPARVSLIPRNPTSTASALVRNLGFLNNETPVSLHLRSDLHLARKAWHMVMGSVIAYLFWAGMPIRTAITILGSVLAWDLMMETARLRIPAFNDKIMRVWGPFMRDCERNRMSGVPHYISATILAISIFPKPVAILSILFLAFGDPIASLFGILYGKKSIRFANGKSLIGTSAGVVTCALLSLLFLRSVAVSSVSLLALTVIGGLAGGLAELVPLDVDDNFTIPVISGFVLWLGFIVFGI